VHTALSFDLVGEDVLITGAGPIGIMAAAVARHVGARHVVITDINPDRLDLAAQVADVVPVNVATEDLRDVMARLKMRKASTSGWRCRAARPALDQMVEALVMGGASRFWASRPASRRSTGRASCSRRSPSRASTAARSSRPGTR
jgi:threonine 3-dehydrogenase